MRPKCVAQIGRPQQVALDERPRHDRVPMPFAQVIQRHRTVTPAREHFHHVRADVTGPTRHKHCPAHLLWSLGCMLCFLVNTVPSLETSE